MTAVLLVSGALVRKPEKRVSKGGTPYLTATIRDKGGEGNSARYFSLVTFSETCIAELDGDAVSVQGAFSIEEFEGRDGARKQTLKVWPSAAAWNAAQRRDGV